ncbi:uncharacterized protein LOC144422820 [Styela clava]
MNSQVINQARVKQSDRLMTSYDRFKEKGFLCDFNINVGEKSFRVHRTVLAASSEYFEAMFSSNLKEVHDGHIIMKDVDKDGIAQCVEFMYKGKANLKIENIQHILHASNLLQMVELTNLCFQFLEINISPINCLSVINLAQMYDRHDIKQQAEQVVIDNFESVISSEMFPFVAKSDLLRYMRNETYQTSWKAVVTWAKRKDNVHVSELVSIEQYPFKFLLGTVLEEPIVKNNKTAEKSVITALFSDVKKLETNLEIDNCFILKNLSETNQIPEQTTVKDSINRYLETNFEQIIKKNEFRDISKDDIIRLFKSSGTKYSSEAVKYEAMMKWVKHDVKNRRKIFQDLFSLLKLGDLSLKFLKETVRIEPLVKKSDKCNDSLIDELFSRASLKAEEKPKAEQPLALPVSKDDEEGSSVIGGASGYGTASSRPANGSVVRSSPEKEVVKVKEEFEEIMKQMELKNEQEKTRMLKEMENPIKKTKEEEVVKVRRESERMRKEHEEEMRRVQKEKRKMEIENEKLKTEKKDFAQPSNISATNQLAVSTSANKSIFYKTAKTKCQDIAQPSNISATNQLAVSTSANKSISQKTAKVKCQGAESQSSSQTTSGLRIINQQPSDGKWSWDWLQESLPGYEGEWTRVITYSFPAGSLKGVSYEAQEFTEYLPWNDGRICLGLLYRAFNAGLIFKIQEVDDRRGKIVWNDEFPHKTNRTGGPEKVWSKIPDISTYPL